MYVCMYVCMYHTYVCIHRTDQEVIARNAAEVTENQRPVQGSSDVAATMRLLSILSEFHDDDVITGCNVTPLAKGKLKRLAASFKSKRTPSTNTFNATAGAVKYVSAAPLKESAKERERVVYWYSIQ
jgi:hypothetical protein